MQDALCVSGGFLGSVRGKFSCAVFDPTENNGAVVWFDQPSMKLARQGHTFVSGFSGRLFVLGGLDADGNYLSSVETFAFKSGSWEFAPTPLSSVRAFHVAQTLVDKDNNEKRLIYVAGGLRRNDQLADDLEVYHIIQARELELVFESLIKISARSHLAMTLFYRPDQVLLCLIGGRNNHSQPVSDVECFGRSGEEIGLSGWDLPQPRAGLAAINLVDDKQQDQKPDEILVVGGDNSPTFTSFNGSEWGDELKMGTPRTNHTLTRYKDWACALGGVGNGLDVAPIECFFRPSKVDPWAQTAFLNGVGISHFAAISYSIPIPTPPTPAVAGTDLPWWLILIFILLAVFLILLSFGLIVYYRKAQILRQQQQRQQRSLQQPTSSVIFEPPSSPTSFVSNSSMTSQQQPPLSVVIPDSSEVASDSSKSPHLSPRSHPVSPSIPLEEEIPSDAPAAKTPVGQLLRNLRLGRYCQIAADQFIEEISDLSNIPADKLATELSMAPAHARRLVNAVAELEKEKLEKEQKEQDARKRDTQPEFALEEVEYGTLITTRNLGRGSFGTVDQCIWRGADSAIKTLLDAVGATDFEKEVRINRRLLGHPHPCVTRMIALTTNPRGIIMELYTLHSVADFVIKQKNLTADEDLPKILSILIEASAGVVHLHSQGIVHQDLAARNFLLKSDLSTAVCDFGLSRVLAPGEVTGARTLEEQRTDQLPITSSAPETLSEGYYSPKSDVYMFGTFIWEIFSRQEPHGDAPEFDQSPPDYAGFVAKVVFQNLRPTLPESWPPAIVELIAECWDFHPARRPSMIQINERLRALRDASANMPMPQPLPPPHAQPVVFYESVVYAPRAAYDGYVAIRGNEGLKPQSHSFYASSGQIFAPPSGGYYAVNPAAVLPGPHPVNASRSYYAGVPGNRLVAASSFAENAGTTSIKD